MPDFDVTAHSNAVRSYVDWANANTSDAIAGQRQGAGVSNLKDVTTGFARLFNRASVSTAKQTAIDGFKAALTTAVGSTIADEVWRGIGGDSVKGLTPGIIRTGISLANRLVNSIKAQLLSPRMETKTFLFYSGAEIDGLVNPMVDAQTIRAYGKLNVLLAKADSLCCMSPASAGEAQAIARQMRVVADALANSIPNDLKPQDEINARLQAQILRNKADELNGQTQFLPDGQDPRIGLARHWQESLAAACGKLTRTIEESVPGMRNLPQETRTRILRNYEELQRKFASLQASYAGDKMFKAVEKKKNGVCEKIGAELAKCVSSAFGKNIPAAIRDVYKTAFKEAHLSILNKKSWETIDNHFEGFIGAKKISLNSKITCGRHIDAGIGNAYDEGVNAYNCHTANTSHAINLATSELTVNGQTVFRGVRHGAHNAKVGDAQANAAANVNRAKETVHAAFVEFLKMNPNPRVTNGVIEFRVNSVSLMTPSLDERDKFSAQKAAWDAVNNQEMTVSVNGQTYRIRPQITTFSYGVNSLALKHLGNPLNGWGNVSAMNTTGLNGMLGRAEQFANAHNNRKVKDAVRTLIAQIREIADNKLERSQGTEPYKMPARLAVLSYLMGEVPVWNCKSGKDRTGMLDVEAKFLSTLIDQGLPIPKPNEKLSIGQTRLLRTILMQSGNLEMQQYNTGVAGYKLKHVPSIFSRLDADKDAKDGIMGGSSYIGG